MADGRNYTTWQPGAVINEKIRENNDIKYNWDYRTFLQNNALKIMQSNSVSACNNCGSCPPVYIGNQNPVSQSNVPFVFSSTLDNSQPFGYETSDLKNMYLSRNELQSRMSAPHISQSQMLMQGLARSN